MVYVDGLKEYASGWWCHLTADGEEELHRFAQQLGLQRRWYQNKGWKWHYDLNPEKRRQAVLLGAQEITTRQMVTLMRQRRERLDGAVLKG